MFRSSQHPRYFTTGVLFFCFGVLIYQPVCAQTPPSPFDGSNLQATNTQLPDNRDDETPVAKAPITPNKYLDTFITLQRQNVLLTQLVEREKAVTDMVQNYKKMGIAYEPPKPDLQTCLELPKNLACATAYPDRYADFLPPPMPLPAVPVLPVAVSTEELPQAITKLAPDAGLKNLMWTDITCLQGSCRAVITPDPSDPSARYSVKAGDALPPGGTVERISQAGITIVHGKDMIHIPPAPSRPFAM